MSTPEDNAAQLNAGIAGFTKTLGLHFVRASAEEVVAEVKLGPEHHQPHGIVHGGVHAGIIETVASVGAGFYAQTRGLTSVGLENHTSFLHAVREGVLHATATPLTRGRRTQVWEVVITDTHGRIAAKGQVRLLCLDKDAQLAGEKATLKEPMPS